MTTQTDLERALRGYYDATAVEPAVDRGSAADVRAVMEQVAGLRQRPGWLVGVLGNGSVAAPRHDWRAGARSAALLALLSLLVLVALWVAGQQPPPLSGRGLLAFSHEGDIYLADHEGRNPVRILHDDGLRLSVDSWSADGRWLMVYAPDGPGYQAILVEASTLRVLRVEGWPRVWAPQGAALALGSDILDPNTGDRRRVASGELIGWSPDGSELAVRDGERRLRIVRADTGEGRDVGVIPLYDGSSMPWSPDSRWIYGVLGDAERDLVRIGTQRGEMTMIVRDIDTNLGLSPDGRWFVVVMDAGLPSPGSDLVRIDARTGEAKVLVESAYVPYSSWAPDSSRLAFQNEGALWTIEVDGTGLAQVAPTSAKPAFATWSPDGEWIAYWGASANDDFTHQLMATRPDGDELRIVNAGMSGVYMDSSTLGHRLRWAADAAWQPIARGATPPALPVTASVPPTRPSASAAVPAKGPPADPRATAGGFAIASRCRVEWLEFVPSGRVPSSAVPECEESSGGPPRWAPDSSAVMFDAHPGYLDSGQPAGPDRFVILARDGTVLLDHRPPDPRGANDTTPTFEWSEDGRWLVSQTDDAIRPDGSGARRLPGPPSWSSDGSRVAVVSPDGNLLVGTGDTEDLRPIGRFPLPSSWAPDASRFAFVRDGNAWLADADGRAARAVTDFRLGGVTDLSWSTAGNVLLVERGSSLYLVTLDSGDARMLGIPVRDPRDPHLSDAIWSPDGSSIAFSENDNYPTYIVTVTDGRVVALDLAGQPVWSPDSQFLAVMSGSPGSDGLPHIDVVRRDGSGRQTMWTADRGGLYSFVWLTKS